MSTPMRKSSMPNLIKHYEGLVEKKGKKCIFSCFLIPTLKGVGELSKSRIIIPILAYVTPE